VSLHYRTHPEPQPDCFACKLAGINWGIVPGGYRDVSSTTMFDRDQLPQGLPTNEEVMDRRSRFRRNILEAERGA